MMNSIYLDNAATTRPKREVIDAMMPYFTEYWYNPSSLYSAGMKVKEDIDSSKKIIADFIGADSSEIYFTSGGSESNCWALRGFVDNARSNRYTPVIITTNIEHKSIKSCVEYLYKFADTDELEVDENGFVNMGDLESSLNYYDGYNYKVLVSIQMANNEIGTIQNIKEISDIVRRYNATLHVDAVQSFGNISIDVRAMGIDMLSASGHKIGTPKGIGILYKSKDIEINPLIFGSQMDGLRGGTENVPYIIGMAKAVELAKDHIKYISQIELYRDLFISKLEEIGCELVGDRTNRLPNNISVMLPDGVGGEEALYLFDLSNIMVSVGSACNSRSVEPSYVLKAIGLSDEEARRVIRITLNPDDLQLGYVDNVVNEIEKIKRLLSC